MRRPNRRSHIVVIWQRIVAAYVLAPDNVISRVHRSIAVEIADRDARHATAEEICTRTGAAAVQQVGKVLVLWRPKPEDGVVTSPDTE